MSPQEINVKLAEIDGWKHRDCTNDNPIIREGMRLPNRFCALAHGWWRDDDPENTGVYASPPDYWSDPRAVLPLLEKAGYRATGNRCGSTHASTVVVLSPDTMTEHLAQADYTMCDNSFTAAACLALLKARGIAVEPKEKETQ